MLPGGSDYFTFIQNMKLIANKFKSGGLHEKRVVSTWNLGNHLSICCKKPRKKNSYDRYNDRHPVTKTFTPFHYTSLYLSILHFFPFKLHPATLHYSIYQSAWHKYPRILASAQGLAYRVFSNLIRTSFCGFLKRKKKRVSSRF